MGVISGFSSAPAILLIMVGAVFSQGAPKPKEKIPRADAGNPAEDGSSKSKTKLPTHFSKLGLSADQTKAVLQIQARYQEEIRQLNRKMAELKKSMKTELNEVLGPEQKSRLEELQKSAKATEKD